MFFSGFHKVKLGDRGGGGVSAAAIMYRERKRERGLQDVEAFRFVLKGEGAAEVHLSAVLGNFGLEDGVCEVVLELLVAEVDAELLQ